MRLERDGTCDHPTQRAIPAPGSHKWLLPVHLPEQNLHKAAPTRNRCSGVVLEAEKIRDRVTLSYGAGPDAAPQPILYDRTGRVAGSAKMSGSQGGTIINNYHVNVLVLVNAPA